MEAKLIVSFLGSFLFFRIMVFRPGQTLASAQRSAPRDGTRARLCTRPGFRFVSFLFKMVFLLEAAYVVNPYVTLLSLKCISINNALAALVIQFYINQVNFRNRSKNVLFSTFINV